VVGRLAHGRTLAVPDKLLAMGMDIDSASPMAFGALQHEDAAKWERVIRAAKVVVEQPLR
jgi:hypothetical protein